MSETPIPPPALVVLAAGMGSRYGGLKQIDPVGPHGEVVLDYSVFDACRAGFGSVVFVIRRDLERAFRETVGRRFEDRLEVRYAFQELDALPRGSSVPAGRTKPWGTGHAVLCARPAVQEPFAVINADDFYGADAYRQLATFLTTPPDAGRATYAMVGFELGRTLSAHGTTARGLCVVDAAGCLQSVHELTAIERTVGGARNREPDGSFRALTGIETVSMNCWGFTPGFFDHLAAGFSEFLRSHGTSERTEFYLPFAVNSLIERGAAQVKVLPTDSNWFGVTYREDRPVVVESIRRLIHAGAYPEQLWP
jgi:dTDP-glucose pyrophosphorylase